MNAASFNGKVRIMTILPGTVSKNGSKDVGKVLSCCLKVKAELTFADCAPEAFLLRFRDGRVTVV